MSKDKKLIIVDLYEALDFTYSKLHAIGIKSREEVMKQAAAALIQANDFLESINYFNGDK